MTTVIEDVRVSEFRHGTWGDRPPVRSPPALRVGGRGGDVRGHPSLGRRAGDPECADRAGATGVRLERGCNLRRGVIEHPVIRARGTVRRWTDSDDRVEANRPGLDDPA